MKRIFILLLLASLCIADDAGKQFGGQTSSFTMEIGRNWQLLSIIDIAGNWQLLSAMALMISVILVAIAYVIGIGLEMPEMKAWAGTELVQIITNAIIVGLLIVTLVFIEMVVLAIVQGSGLNTAETAVCYGQGANAVGCLQGVTNAYLNSYIETAESNAKGILKDNMFAAGMVGRRIGLNCLTIFCAQMGNSITVGGQYILKSDMYMIIFDHYTNLIASMEAQKFFVNAIAFRMGPVIMALGVVARCFFPTRKLGGLLIAIAAGMMFFFPAMYIFDWVTLDNVLNGDKAGSNGAGSDCPDECKMTAPAAYVDADNKLNNTQEVYNQFNESDKALAQGLMNGTVPSAVATAGVYNGRVITSCYTPISATECPVACRELPYPSMPLCNNVSAGTPEKCAAVPAECKVIRTVKVVDPAQDSNCPADCKVVPPLRSNCDVDKDGNPDPEHKCVNSAPDCRMVIRGDDTWVPEKTCSNKFEGCKEIKKRCEDAQSCPGSEDAYQSCRYIVPQSGRCDDICAACPPECRITGSGAIVPDYCPAECTDCMDGCVVQWSALAALAGDAFADGKCSACEIYKRLTYSNLPDEYANGSCSYDNCPPQYRAVVPFQSCEMCTFTEERYVYNPPLNTQCNDICKPSDTTPVADPSAFTQIGDTGLVGLSPVQNIAKLMIPAYLLPLFNIMATIIFIKGLSDLLGGDIEIPGLSKVF
ncbi:hypothetical protein H0O00_03365 [Candidatus Micrarchaeota archaeon]|nr:hypothetical protein [Candidatus Micrarchaeota archaeon]